MNGKIKQKIGLGTVQFGLPYGISNISGQVNSQEVRKILETAIEYNCTVIDTAPSYGNAESILGENRDILPSFRIFSKTPILKHCKSNKIRTFLESTFFKSLKNLGLEKIEGLLVHHASDLTGNNGQKIISVLRKLKAQGIVKKIGYSCYTPEDAVNISDFFIPDIIQIPVNVFNQEFIHHPIFARLKKIKCEIHARSLFLQGLVFLSPDQVDPYFFPFKDFLNKFHYDLNNEGISPLEACLNYVLQISGIDYVLIGICCKNELQDVIKASHSVIRNIPWNIYRNNDPRFINPSFWNLKL